MEKLLAYLNSLSKEDRTAFVTACQTTEGYLRKAVSVRQRLGTRLCISLERESRGTVTCEDLIPDADWAYIRSSYVPQPKLAISRRKPPTVPA